MRRFLPGGGIHGDRNAQKRPLFGLDRTHTFGFVLSYDVRPRKFDLQLDLRIYEMTLTPKPGALRLKIVKQLAGSQLVLLQIQTALTVAGIHLFPPLKSNARYPHVIADVCVFCREFNFVVLIKRRCEPS